MADLFESAWLKWAMAGLNAQVLRDNVVTLSGQSNLQVESLFAMYYDAKRHCIVVTVAEVADPFPVLWGLLLGDVVHNYRSCLDHLAWALYKRGRTPHLPAKQERSIYFPISGDRANFNASLKRNLPGVRRADIAIVRRYQPYKRGKRNVRRHVFTVLAALSNADKHRTIQPVVAVTSRITFNKTRATDCIFREVLPGVGYRGTLDPGTEIARIYVKKTGPQPDVEMEPHFTFTPAINDRLTLIDFLSRTMRATATVLHQFSEPTERVRSLVADSSAASELPPMS